MNKLITKHAKNMCPDRFHMDLNSKGALDGPVYIILSGLDDNYLEPLNRHVLSWMVSDEMGLR